MTVKRTLWLLYTAFIVYGTTIPFEFAGDSTIALDKLRHVPLNPFVSPDTGLRLSIPDVVQNVLLFLPFGALGFLTGKSAGRSFRRVLFVTLLATALSTMVEGLQLLTIDRTSSVADIVMNSTGAFLGAVLAWTLRDAVTAVLFRLRVEGLAIAELRPLTIASLLLLIAFWQPFDVTLDVGTVASKVRALESNVWQFDGLRDEGTLLMLSAFFAMAFGSYLSVLGERRVARWALAFGIGSVLMLEASQILIGSRMPGLWDATVAATGVAAGVAMWSAAGRFVWPRFWLAVLVAATFVAAALQMLSPFQLASSYQSFGWFPFLGYYVHTTFETLSHVIELMLLYFPLGFWLGASSVAPSGPLARRSLAESGAGPVGSMLLASALALAIAAPVEYLQGWVVGRYPDISDVGFSLFGAWLGVRTGLTRT